MASIRFAATMFVLLCGNYGSGAAMMANARRLPPATLLASDTEQIIATIRWLEDKVKLNPDDFIAYTKLAGYYLQRQRETGNSEYLMLARRAAHASLAILPAEQNYSGLAALAQTEQALHNFVAARDYAARLTQLGPDKSVGFEILADAQLELGEYDNARRTVDRLQRFTDKTVGTQIRLGKYALLHGRVTDAVQFLSDALVSALEQSPPSRETVVWCRWQLGEMAFAVGEYLAAEQHYKDALTTFPGFWRASAALARVRAARGDLLDAISQYEQVIRILPDLTFVAVLGDLYRLTGNEKEATVQYTLVAQIARLNTGGGALYNRQLALFYADHDRNAEEAYASATQEYKVRQDIYGADAVAWTALKVGKVAEAETAIRAALRLGTHDARLFYHAGMIARASGDWPRARSYLAHALALSPQFDLLQAGVARQTLNQSPGDEREPLRSRSKK